MRDGEKIDVDKGKGGGSCGLRTMDNQNVKGQDGGRDMISQTGKMTMEGKGNTNGRGGNRRLENYFSTGRMIQSFESDT